MRLLAKFSPPSFQGGSQHTYARHLIPSLYALEPELRILTRVPEAFPAVPAHALVSLAERRIGPERGLLGALGEAVSSWRWEGELRPELVLYLNQFEAMTRGRAPAAVVIHDAIPLIYRRWFPRTAPLFLTVFRLIAMSARAVLTCSERSKSDLVRLLRLDERKVHVFYPSCQTLPGGDRPTSAARDPYFLYVSSNHYPYKNVAGVVDALAELGPRVAHRLVVVGQHHPRFTPGIVRHIAERGLTSRVELRQNLSSTELGMLYAGADLFVYPSLYEGFGIPLLEAMAAGVPIVAARRASVPEVCGRAALYVDPTESGALAAAIGEALERPSLRADLVQLGLQRVKLFSWERCAADIMRACRIAAA